jgi:hypothetical protein
MSETRCDILIVGGGTGGCAAAMAATAAGRRVVMTEETDWIGGQLTAQAVPPDEHRWIEQFGCTQRYRAWRDGVRRFYRQHYPLTPLARANPRLNPGQGRVSALCHEPRVALAVIEQMLAWPRAQGLLDVRLGRKPVGALADADRVRAVKLLNTQTGHEEIVHADYILDATELGELLPMAGVECVCGFESQRDTGEPHAPAEAQPDNVQAITWCFPMGYDPAAGADHVIDKPAQYDFWRAYLPQMTPPWPDKLLSWTQCHPPTLEPRHRVLFPQQNGDPGNALWLYRRIICRDHYPPGAMPQEVTLVNWPQNDYWLGNIIDKPPDQVAKHLQAARQLSLSLLYWMQTEAPRPDGAAGYPGLSLRPDITGTDDGLAKYPYIRESRRIRAVFTVTENHVGTTARGGHSYDYGQPGPQPAGLRAEPFDDSVGVGSYRIDLHPSTGGDNYIDVSSLPFQIPLGALIPVRVENLLPACKNLGVTHITNGCYRLHPVEWNIGEAAGLLAAFCLDRDTVPRRVRDHQPLLREFQARLQSDGIELDWPVLRPR